MQPLQTRMASSSSFRKQLWTTRHTVPGTEWRYPTPTVAGTGLVGMVPTPTRSEVSWISFAPGVSCMVIEYLPSQEFKRWPWSTKSIKLLAGTRAAALRPARLAQRVRRLARLWEARVMVRLCMGNAVGWAGQVLRLCNWDLHGLQCILCPVLVISCRGKKLPKMRD